MLIPPPEIIFSMQGCCKAPKIILAQILDALVFPKSSFYLKRILFFEQKLHLKFPDFWRFRNSNYVSKNSEVASRSNLCSQQVTIKFRFTFLIPNGLLRAAWQPCPISDYKQQRIHLKLRGSLYRSIYSSYRLSLQFIALSMLRVTSVLLTQPNFSIFSIHPVSLSKCSILLKAYPSLCENFAPFIPRTFLVLSTSLCPIFASDLWCL
jgi:hypothetical protein